ncbi:MAG TPA: glycoside hydrolase family 13 protein, partial [Pseudobdellovibrionaceae bacterium]|nr:glycoside hydrolase family 13 protein [Pseudobdellovibrionaceae bacterium]
MKNQKIEIASSSAFSSSPTWVPTAVFYQIFPDRFAFSAQHKKPLNLEPWDSAPTTFGFKGGDLLGVIERLDYLEDLGINALYFTPIFSSTANHRYHTHDYYHIDWILGGNEAFRSLLKAAHSKGMKVILDGVFNHASRGFYQFNHTLENGKFSPFIDWFHFNQDWLESGEPINAYAIHHGHHKKTVEETSLGAFGYQAWWDIPSLPKFNTKNPEVREFLFNVVEYWTHFGIDGWRLDVPMEINDDSFWQEFRRRVHAINPEAYIVGEIWEEADRWLKGDQFDGVMNYQLSRACIGFFLADHLNEEELQKCGYKDIQRLSAFDFSKRLNELMTIYPKPATYCQMNLLGSHDTPRILTSGSGDVAGVKMSFLCLMTIPGAPCIYYGDEIGM